MTSRSLLSVVLVIAAACVRRCRLRSRLPEKREAEVDRAAATFIVARQPRRDAMGWNGRVQGRHYELLETGTPVERENLSALGRVVHAQDEQRYRDQAAFEAKQAAEREREKAARTAEMADSRPGIGRRSRIVDWYMDRRIEIDRLITHKLPLEKLWRRARLLRARERRV